MKAFVANRSVNHAMVGVVKEGQMFVVADDYPFLNSITSEEAFRQQILSEEENADLELAWEEFREGGAVAILQYSDFFQATEENVTVEGVTLNPVLPTEDAPPTPPTQPTQPAPEQPAPDVFGAAPVLSAMITSTPASEQPASEQPASEQPASEQPASEQSDVKQPSGSATEQPALEQPDVEQPTVEQPSQPVVEQPKPSRSSRTSKPQA